MTLAGPQIRVRPAEELTASDRLTAVVSQGKPVGRTVRSRLEAVAGTALAEAAAAVDAPPPDPHRVMRTDTDPTSMAATGAAIGRAAATDEPIDCLLPGVAAASAKAFARGLTLGAQRIDGTGPHITLWIEGPARVAAATAGADIAGRTLLARTLANTPSNIKDPAWLARQAQAVAGGALTVTVHGPDWLHHHGFGGILAVAAGSARPPRLVHMEYRGATAGPHVVLVGKGITFDSGGLSLKPPPSMPLMKTDMSGGAAVIAALAAVRDAGIPLRVSGLVAWAENMPSGSAMRPGDVIRHYGGRTTEVLNTDAEGRLVLADALAYAADTLSPDVMVDLATLTGAATVGLGRQHAALYATSDRLASALVAAGEAAGEPVWRMPLVPEYRPAIDSVIADSANTNTDTVTQAGSITAALFLQPFTGAVTWAHLDIAGTGRTESDRPDCRKGATGFGVGLLTEWLARLSH